MDPRFICMDCRTKWFVPAGQAAEPDLVACDACGGRLVALEQGPGCSGGEPYGRPPPTLGSVSIAGTEIALSGLTEAEAGAAPRGARGAPAPASSRSYGSIIRANTLNVPNGILLLFGGPDAHLWAVAGRAVPRDPALEHRDRVIPVPVDQVVVGDLVRLAAGDQVVTDGRLVIADGLALDEANLTGESEPAVRGPGEPVWSGSFAVEGAALVQATAVGADSRAARLTATARAFRHPRSPLERANDRLLLWLVAFAVPLAIGQRVGAHPC